MVPLFPSSQQGVSQESHNSVQRGHSRISKTADSLSTLIQSLRETLIRPWEQPAPRAWALIPHA